MRVACSIVVSGSIVPNLVEGICNRLNNYTGQLLQLEEAKLHYTKYDI